MNQLDRAGRYRNVLVELELGGRGQVVAALAATAPSLADLRARSAELEGTIDETRARVRRHRRG